MTSSSLHDRVPAPASFPRHDPLPQPMAGSAHLRRGRNLAPEAGDPATATTPEPSARPADATGSAPASQQEFYQCFGLALLGLIAIAVLVAARG
ncbi:hypothetical protein SAMN04515666_1085 [Bosea lupini]|jgi:hypothetical protein|uniref:Uncharacterized protein n=1 Tax=Bosea lupini TaxID=1036779 RepID=A0A1H7W5H8_9HYPH|nr:hypothetical protein [Bosea lupini]SEM16268.1 hypothetical protein SAMN04515666_1085 [Bosea lupini]